jgi:hypothetical protein
LCLLGDFAGFHYYKDGQAALLQVAFVVCGAAFQAALKWMTPSSLEQKPLTPVVLNPPADPPTVYCTNGAAADVLPMAK